MLAANISHLYTTLWLLVLFVFPFVQGLSLPNTRRQSASAPLKAGLGWGGGGNISQFEGHEVSWYFTWSPQSWVVPAPTQLEFVPQLWGERDVQTFASVVNATSIATNGWKNLLGMNEPELPAQANMAAQDGVNFWKAHLEPLKSTGIRLGSPATTSGPNGKKWMQDFFTLCAGNCTVDFLALHWYGNVAEEFIAYLEDFHNTFQRPIWITEYSCQNFVNGAQCTYEEIVQFLNTTQTYMDQTSWVEHYAWFGAMASLPNNVNQLTALMDPSGVINDLGRQYIGSPVTEPNPTVSSALPTSTTTSTSSTVISSTSTSSSTTPTSPSTPTSLPTILTSSSTTSTSSSSTITSSTSSRTGTPGSLTATPAATTSPYVIISAALPECISNRLTLLFVLMLSCFLAC
ncbi:Alkali-sensitive linkage protein 1 [Rhizoctonia solani]|uniref:Alkali-sensitive linkage protein 1 n=1 Tax=Rhizoctonia solani TaxID=456999 RepID=A0A0K6FN85_9AGAM|nr:Alkali-sensitive linkage protein 1 [Rhizoctonia solani]